MFDEIAIQQTLNRYSDGSSRQDWPQVLATFMPDGVWAIEGGDAHQGHIAIDTAMRAFMAKMSYYIQINAPAVITVSGDHATARSIIRESGRIRKSREALEVHGFYQDELIRVNGQWLFLRKTFHALGMHRFALMEGPILPE